MRFLALEKCKYFTFSVYLPTWYTTTKSPVPHIRLSKAISTLISFSKPSQFVPPIALLTVDLIPNKLAGSLLSRVYNPYMRLFR